MDVNSPPSVSGSAEWAALCEHAAVVGSRHLRDLFADDPARSSALTFDVAGLRVDLSKQRIVSATVPLLAAVARRAGVEERIAALLGGERLNVTEQRAALHTALRAPADATVVVDGRNVVPDVQAALVRMAHLADRIRSGAWRGATGERVRHVVNVGIGGSDLGPAMAYQALHSYVDVGLDCRFVSNVDGADVTAALRDLDPAATLVVVSSKTFTTVETMTNARTVRSWLTDLLGPGAVRHHMVAVSTNVDEAQAFGIDPDNVFGFWDWVGGRYSLDSAIGLSLMIAIGADRFAQMLAGMRAVDEHLAHSPLERNVPVLMALVGVWNNEMLGAESLAVLPYSHELSRFPAYLQQLDMESNGKRVRLDGSPVEMSTGPVVWGEPGTNGQHAFFQLLHQGTRLVPVDFIGVARPNHSLQHHHDLLIANLLAQSSSLAFGRTREEAVAAGVPEWLADHRTFPGNRPSTVILADRLDPFALGALVALYEHKVFVQACVWGINAFDQWGVELGKEMATRLMPRITGTVLQDGDLDSATSAIVEWYRQRRETTR